MNKLCLAVLLCAALCAPARADSDFWFNGGARGTAGTHSYFGSDWWAQLGSGDLSVKPMFSEYHSDLSSGTYKTISARAAYDTKLLGLGLTVGGTPKENGYSNGFVGVDGTLSITPGMSGPVKRISSAQETSGPARGKGVARIDIGGAFLHTTHRDDLQAVSGEAGMRGGRVASRGSTLSIGQNDLTGSVGVSVLDVLASVDVTKSIYSRDLAAVNARAAQVVRLTGVASAIQGFPDTSTSVRVELGMLPLITPYADYVHTKYELSQPDSNALTVGGYAELGIVEVSASYEHLAQSGQVDENYLSLGGTVRF